MKFEFILPMDIWNHAVRALRRGRALAGVNCILGLTPWGTFVSARDSMKWRHPWFTTPFWNAELTRWEAEILPGFSGMVDPVAVGVESPDPFSNEKRADTPLIEMPRIPLRNFRAIGNDEDGGAVPPLFQALGVRPSGKGASVVSGDELQLDTNTDVAPGRRYLRASDFVLRQARPTLIGEVSIVDPSGVSGSQAQYAARADFGRVDRVGPRPRVTQEAEFVADHEPTVLERLEGLYQDSGEDTRLVSTLYFLSPEDGAPGDPDGGWTPFVKHSLFWNLGYAGRNDLTRAPLPPIVLFTGLLGGVGDLLDNQILSQINDATGQIDAAFNTASPKGMFWTT